MAVGTGIGFDISQLDAEIKKADEALKSLGKTGERASKQINEAFSLAKNGNIQDFISVIERMSNTLSKKGYNQAAQMIREIATETTSAIDRVNRFTTLMQTINDGGRSNVKNGAIESLKYQLDEALSRLGVLNEQLQFYAKGAGAKAVGANVVDTSALQDEANKLRVVVELLQRRLESEQAIAALKRRSGSIEKQQSLDSSWQRMEEIRTKELQQQSINAKEANKAYEQAYNDRYQMYASMYDKMWQKYLENFSKQNASAKSGGQQYAAEYEQKRRYYEQWINESYLKEQEQKKNLRAQEEAEQKRINQAIFQERIDQLGKESRERLKIEEMIRETQRKNHAQREKELNDLFREQERQQKAQAQYDSKARRERYNAYVTSYEGAIRTSDKAKTLAQETQAVKNLEAARAKLSKTDTDYQKKLDELNKRIKTHNENIKRATEGAKELESAHSKLGSKIATVFSAQAIVGYINKMIKVRGEMELQQRSLQAILQDKDKANEVWQKTIDLAVKSPFRINQLVNYTKQLAAYRVEADKLYDTNKMLADVSAGLGVDMQRLILAFGQVKAANFLRGTELRQFTEAGIPMLDELAKLYTKMEGTLVTSGEVFDRISKRMVLFEDVEKVFEKMTQAGGTFYRMQEIQSETLKGQISNLKDSVDIMLNDMGKSNDGILKFSVKTVKGLVDNYKTLIPVLKALIAYLALYKISAFKASEATLVYARSMNMAKVSGAGLGGMLTSLRVSLHKFGASMGSTLKLITANPWMLLATGILAAVTAFIKYRKELKAVNKQYADMLNQQSEITAKFFKAEDLEKQKEALQELIEYAEKEYAIKVSLDLEPMSSEEVRKELNDLRQQMLDANAFGATFQQELIRANAHTRWDDFATVGIFEQGLFKDVDQMGDAYDDLSRMMLNKLSPTIDALSVKWEELTEDQKTALESLKAGIGEWTDGDEDVVEYFDRIREAYSALIKGKAIEDSKLVSQLSKYSRRIEEAEKEFKTFIDRIDETVKSKTDEEKTIFISAAIDDAASERNWTEFEETQIRKWLEKEYKIKLVPEIVQEDANLEAWQETYNSMFVGTTGFREIEKKGTSQKQVIERLNGAYEATAELLERIKLAGEDSVLEGGAYEGQDLEKLKRDLAEIKAQLDWFGAKAKDNDKESAAVKILQKRINLLKEVNKKYLELEKTFDAATAKEKVMEAYADTFREAFEGTGVELDMYKIMTQVITDSKNVGEDMGAALSEGVVAKLKELEESGTYIRTANSAAEEFTKGWEQAILKAKDVEGEGKGYTIGYGEYGIYKDTKKKIGKNDVMTQEEAAERFSRVVYPKYVDGLNKILDKHKELILTQEQYNALLDLTYQGGYGGWSKRLKRYVKGPAELLIDYAKNEEQALAHIQKIRESFAKAYGEDEAARRFGDAFVERLKQAETIYEKMALLLSTMNLTISGEVNKDYPGMVSRTDARVELFSGGLDIAKQLETVLVRIAGMDFTTTEGMIEALGKLKEIAEKEGPEAKNILSQAISGLEAEIGVRLKKDADKKLNDEVQALFDRYELTVDLKKLNLPKDLAEQLFDVKYLDLEGLRKAVQDKASEFVGTDQYEKYKEFLEKIDEMERKSIIERTKKYSEYLKEGMNKRVELKVEELRKLKELEESKEFEPKQKEQIRKQIRLDTQKQLDKESWDQFQATDWYTMMFTDLETLGTQAIKNLRDELSALKDSLAHLDPSEVKEIVSQMEKLQEQLIARNPFEAFRDAREDIKALGATEEDVIGQLKAYEDNERNAQKMLDMLAEIENARATGSLGQLSGETLTYFRSLRDEVFAGNKEAFNDARKTYEHILSEAQAGKKLTSEQVKMFQDYRKSLQGIADYWGEIDGKVQSIVGSAINIMDVYGVDEATKSIAEGVGSMSTLITQAIQFGIQMKIAGVAANNALGIIGWAAIAIQAIATIISSIANYKNAQIDKQLEEQAKKIEVQRDLYEQIEKKVEKAYNVDQLREYNAEMKRSVELEIQALEASIALERSRKKADEDQIADWQKEIEEARGRLAESTQSMMQELNGAFDLSDFTSGFIDAWWDAMDEGKKGLDALNEHFNETMKDMVKKQALYRGAQEIMSQVQDAINKSLEGDFTVDEAEWQAIMDAAKKANVNLDAFLQGWYDMFGAMSDGAGGSLSALQKGIQGLSEETGQIIEAYLNSIRGYISEQVTHTKNIYNILYDATRTESRAIWVKLAKQ